MSNNSWTASNLQLKWAQNTATAVDPVKEPLALYGVDTKVLANSS